MSSTVVAIRVIGPSSLALVLSRLLAACGGPSVTVPPDSAPPGVVLDAYLRALVAGDCAAGRALTNTTFRVGNGDLCGQTKVTAYRIHDDPAIPGPEAVFATTLTTTGTSDGSVLAGDMMWFYALNRTESTAWRIAGGGTGP
jgi:hypothetical protein